MRNSQRFLKEHAFIDGEWTRSKCGKTFVVLNPESGEEVAQVSDCCEEDAKTAVEAAHDAFKSWRALNAKERAGYLKRWHALIVEHADELAKILTMEQGKPLSESKGEILGGANSVEWFAEEARRAYGDYLPAHKNDARILVSHEPVGVVGAITPWNFPSAMITRKVAPALAAGCTVVLKPAEDTPLSALALAALAEEAGFPKGVLNVVPTSDAAGVGRILTSDPRVAKISFTGSTAVGKLLMKQAAEQVKKVSLELGGNAPFIVTPSADIEKAIDGLIACKFRNAGQTCISANRIYIHESIYEEFAKEFTEKVKALTIGPGDSEGTDVGPLINQAGIEKVAKLVEGALKDGAEALCGGAKAEDIGTLFYLPTVLTDMRDDMDLCNEEIFGPVAPLYKYKKIDEVIRRANATEYGLASYIYSNDIKEIWDLSDALEYGMVAVNEPFLATELAPFGGIKQSGIGREGGKYGLEEFMEIKYRLIGGL